MRGILVLKNLIKNILLLCFGTVLILVSCSSPSSGNNSGGGASSHPLVENKIGKYGAPYEVGDIVFNDGSATPYSEIINRTENDSITGKKITKKEKDSAIAIIFYVGTGLNSDINNKPDNKTSRTLGVGLIQDKNGLKWCKDSNVKGLSRNIETIQCPSEGEPGWYIFKGDKNGSGNLEQIASFLGTSDNDTEISGNYPAFEFVKNYNTTATLLNSDYASGWYLPSVAELFAIRDQKTIVNAASDLCGGDMFDDGHEYWSSSQSVRDDDSAIIVGFIGLDWSSIDKDNSNYVCAIREF